MGIYRYVVSLAMSTLADPRRPSSTIVDPRRPSSTLVVVFGWCPRPVGPAPSSVPPGVRPRGRGVPSGAGPAPLHAWPPLRGAPRPRRPSPARGPGPPPVPPPPSGPGVGARSRPLRGARGRAPFPLPLRLRGAGGRRPGPGCGLAAPRPVPPSLGGFGPRPPVGLRPLAQSARCRSCRVLAGGRGRRRPRLRLVRAALLAFRCGRRPRSLASRRVICPACMPRAAAGSPAPLFAVWGGWRLLLGGSACGRVSGLGSPGPWGRRAPASPRRR